jgi:hypothetical protein
VLTLAAALAWLQLSACAPLPAEPDESGVPGPYVPHRAPQVPTSIVPEPASPMRWWQDTTLNLAFYTDARLDSIAQCAVAAFQLRLVLSPEGAAVITQLRARNPNIIVLGIGEVLSFVDVWNDPAHRTRFRLSARLYDILSPYAAHRTDGGVATMWNNAPMVNPWVRGGGYNVGLLRRYMDAICDAAMQYPGMLDGVFHDYTSPNPYLYPQPADPTVQADLDGDGVGALSDPDDRAAWTAWQHGLVEEWQARFGPGLIQIANGRLPHGDAVFAGKIAGIHYERFPTTPWGYSDLQGMDLISAHLAPGYLTPRRGRVWSQVLGVYPWYHDLCRMTSMLTGQAYSYFNANATPLGDTVTVDCGAPLAPMIRTEMPDGSVRFTRDFEHGQVLVEMWGTGNTRQAVFLEN